MTELEKQFLQFVGDASNRIVHRKWLVDGNVQVYIRKEFQNGLVVLTINSATWTASREAEFKRLVSFMMEYHPWDATFWETPCNRDIVEWCLNTGWEIADDREFSAMGCLICYKRDNPDFNKWPWTEMFSGKVGEVRGA